jgi:hypothetical protein
MVIVFLYVHFWCVALSFSALTEVRGEGGGRIMQTYIQSMTILVSPMSRCASANHVKFPDFTASDFLVNSYIRSTQLEQIAKHAHGRDSCSRARTLNDQWARIVAFRVEHDDIV